MSLLFFPSQINLLKLSNYFALKIHGNFLFFFFFYRHIRFAKLCKNYINFNIYDRVTHTGSIELSFATRKK